MACRQTWQIAILCAGVVLTTGCVMTEKYEAEKARALNFQRLLAQEEKRTGELDSELKRVKRDATDLEARNRELNAQIQAVREQMAKIQEDATALRDAALLKEQESLSRARKAAPKPKRMEKDLFPELRESPSMSEPVPVPVPVPEPAAPSEGVKAESPPLYHQVRSGETLFSISRQYGVDVKTLKNWNNLTDNKIEVGQRLVVGHE
ncbi:MAG TPA: LysM peptidoglycan-binding domain-containing protein [Nitrospiraceae bacterium]|jgi:LysM repeat protein|nr:LysM peptidoglycan-binding domain-containing protein [Nitrospiraceae bacterium]